MVWPFIAAGISTAGSLYGASSSAKAATAAREAGREASRFTLLETKETLRRKSLFDAQEAGQGVASVAGAGLRLSGSPADYLDFLARERSKENAWTLRAGKLKAKAQREGGVAAGSGYAAQGVLYALQGLSSAANSIDRGMGGVSTGGTE